MHLHLADSFNGDAGERAAPSGVDGGYGAVFGVGEEYGDAVGGLHAEKEAGRLVTEASPATAAGRPLQDS